MHYKKNLLLNMIKNKKNIVKVNNIITDNIITDNIITDNIITDNIITDNIITDSTVQNDITIIKKNNINTLINDFKNIKIVRIFGKGVTFDNIQKKSSEEFHIGINQTVNELSQCDMLVINDLHNIYLIKDEVLKKIKYILTPEYLHINGSFNLNGIWKKVYNYLIEKKFIGKYIIYNLKSNKNPNLDYIDLPSCYTSCNNAIDFACIFLNKYIKNIECYGIGVFSDTNNYNKKFVGNGNYNKYHVDRIKQLIESICKNYLINVNIN